MLESIYHLGGKFWLFSALKKMKKFISKKVSGNIKNSKSWMKLVNILWRHPKKCSYDVTRKNATFLDPSIYEVKLWYSRRGWFAPK